MSRDECPRASCICVASNRTYVRERHVPALLVALSLSLNRSSDFRFNVSHLVKEAEMCPTFSVYTIIRHGQPHSIIRRISKRMLLSSTSHDILPCAGRTIVMESNSMKSSSPKLPE